VRQAVPDQLDSYDVVVVAVEAEFVVVEAEVEVAVAVVDPVVETLVSSV